jgi:Fic family protein
LYKVTIVYPVPATKWLRWIDVETGEVTERRKSPKKGTPQAVFKELYKIKPFLKNPNLSIRILLIDVEETRLLDGWSYDRKKGSHRDNRIPTDLVEDLLLEQVEDYRMLVPPELERFDSKEYAKATKLTVNRARTALNVLYDMGIVERVDKAGNRYLYEVRE